MKSQITWIFLLISMMAYGQNGNGVVINEFLASSDSLSGIADPGGSYADWIEIYNNNTNIVDLAGFFLSDDYTEVDKFVFPVGAQIEADGYVIVWADKDLNEEGLHADFKLKKDGEQIILLNASLEVLDSITYGPQETNVSMARIPNGTGPFVQRAPTFSSNNDEATSVAEVIQSSLRVYPNPAVDFIAVEFPEQDVVSPQQWWLVDQRGQTIPLQANAAGTTAFLINIPDVAAGIYYLWIRAEQHYFVKRVVIQK
jgi:hypothetical protein